MLSLQRADAYTGECMKFWQDKRLRATAIMLFIVLALFVIAIVALWPHIGLLRDQDALAARIDEAGGWAPLVFMGVQTLQVLLAPIPGQVTGFVGGYLFGPWLGLLYSTIGTTVGFAAVFVLARKLGRPFVEYFVHEKHLEKLDKLASRRGAWLLLILFLLPSPDAALGYVAGLTKIRIPLLIAISFIGRLPGIFLVTMAGGAVSDDNYGVLIGVIVVTVAFGLVAYLQRGRINAWLDRFGTEDDQK